jgi:hypothetical protein
MLLMSKFFHRTNANCTIDSICTCCFRTIAVGNTPNDLVGAENTHHCPTGKKKPLAYSKAITRHKRISFSFTDEVNGGVRPSAAHKPA